MRHPDFHIFEFTPDTLAEWCEQRRMPAFRGRQLLEWVYAKGVVDPEAMTNLSKRDREVIAAEMTFLSGDTVADRKASDGTRKLLIEWWDGGRPPLSRCARHLPPRFARPVRGFFGCSAPAATRRGRPSA